MTNFANNFQIVGRAAREPLFYSNRKNTTKVLCPLFLTGQRDSSKEVSAVPGGAAPTAIVTSPIAVEAFFNSNEGSNWINVHTGDLVIVSGHCENWCYPDRETGEAQYKLALVADEVTLLENREVRSARRKRHLEQADRDVRSDTEEKTA